MPRKITKRAGEANGQASSTMPEVSEQAVRELAQVFKLLSDETRLRILFYLAQNNELHVTDLCNRLGQSQPAVSHHLALLRVSGLIESRREGSTTFTASAPTTSVNCSSTCSRPPARCPRRSDSMILCSHTPVSEPRNWERAVLILSN